MAFFDTILLPVQKGKGTSSNLLKTVYEDEYVLGTFRDCDLLDFNQQATPYKQGLAIVSSHNLYWHSPDLSTIVRLELELVARVETHNSIFRRVHRCDIFLLNPPTADRSSPVLSVTFGQKNSNDFRKMIEVSLSRELWINTKAQLQAKQNENRSDAPRAVGVAGIMQRQQEQRERAKQVADEAFSDLQALMQSAQTLVHLVERYSAELGKKQKEKNDEEKDSEQFFNLLNDIGIANPATKKKCGSQYHSELARELSDYLLRSLDRHSNTGMMALTDLYCVVNRARGTQLISPNDLYQACSMFQELNLPFSLRKFDSGALVVQSARLNDEAIITRIMSLFEDAEGNQMELQYLTSAAVAKEFSISLALAEDHLNVAETVGNLCRDETVQETRYYLNRFKSIVSSR